MRTIKVLAVLGLAVALGVLVGQADNVSSFTSAIVDWRAPGNLPLGPAPQFEGWHTEVVPSDGQLHTITVTGTCVAGANNVTVRLKEDDQLLRGADDLLDVKTADCAAGNPPTFTVNLEITCKDGIEIAGPQGRSGEGSPDDDAEIFIEDGTQRIPSRPNATAVWDFVCEKKVVPTLTEWGLIALGVLLAGSMGFVLYRRRPSARPVVP